MTGGVITRTFGALSLKEREILRYMGAREADETLPELIRDAKEECLTVLRPAVVYAYYPLQRREAGVMDLGFAKTDSRSLMQALDGCDGVLVFAATVGLGVDRLLVRYGRLSPARALCIQAIGTAGVEALCDAFCAEQNATLEVAGRRLGARFSPGYGDLPLALQKDIFAALDCPRRIGLTLGEGMLMSPTKSVTAVVGVFRGGRKEGTEK